MITKKLAWHESAHLIVSAPYVKSAELSKDADGYYTLHTIPHLAQLDTKIATAALVAGCVGELIYLNERGITFQKILDGHEHGAADLDLIEIFLSSGIVTLQALGEIIKEVEEFLLEQDMASIADNVRAAMRSLNIGERAIFEKATLQ
jgi:hypothetical protein